MKLKDLQIGKRFELEVFNEIGEILDQPLISEFEWAVDEVFAYIAAPIYEGVIYPIRIGVLMKIYLVHDGQLYTFRARVCDRTVKDNIALLKIQIEGDIEKIQRRQFFRLPCSLQIKYLVLSSLENMKEDTIDCKKLQKSTILKDISGAGLCMLSEEKIDLNEKINCELSLDNRGKIRLTGKIVRVDIYNFESKFRYEIGVAFDEINNKDRDAIIAFIFDEQRKLRKKGLI